MLSTCARCTAVNDQRESERNVKETCEDKFTYKNKERVPQSAVAAKQKPGKNRKKCLFTKETKRTR